MGTDASFYTIADAGFFPGLVALLNSLRLTGNSGELVALDRGLTTAQRRLLEGHVSLVELPEAPAGSPILLKPYAGQVGASGTIFLIDSDMVVTRSLDEIAALARDGRICAFPDPMPHRGRWFAEWEQALELRAPLRRRTYLNAGFLALSTEHWPDLLARWWELCGRVPRDQHFARFEQPFWAGDQDVLNAILASEIPEEALSELPEDEEAYPEDLLEAVIVDERTLRCELRGHPTSILHYSLGPKAWERKAWSASATTPTYGSCPGSSSAMTSPSGWSRSRCPSGCARRSGAHSRPRRRPRSRRRPERRPRTAPAPFATARSRYETRSSAGSKRPASSSWSAAVPDLGEGEARALRDRLQVVAPVGEVEDPEQRALGERAAADRAVQAAFPELRLPFGIEVDVGRVPVGSVLE